MRAVFTYWSKPIVDNPDLASNGYTTSYYELVSFKLAVMQAKSHFGTTVLYSDTAGIERFVNQGFIKFDEVHNVYDNLVTSNNVTIPNSLTVIAKLKSILAETTPFIHLDTSVFFIRTPTTFNVEQYTFLTNDVVAQNIESVTDGKVPEYITGIDYCNNLFSLTALLQYAFIPIANRVAYNCSIIGGSNIVFLQDYANDVLQYLLGLDYYYITDAQVKIINIVMERYYLAAKILSASLINQNITIKPYINNIHDIVELKNLGYINPSNEAKKLETVCLRIESTYNKLK